MPVVKGGVWTNAEDEILKVAVSKYGLNQWARISSLQQRKTAKQCKARWTQWLDPAIKKTEWSKEEDEKLLHLAKLLPQQWLTIAPRVGRTAQQCIERYDKLLSDAQARENDELGLTGPEGGESQAPSADDVRRLRPGEVDPDPESKPARPDTVDMDEDEKEMLSEARARLANTQGKKAKRKARERQLEESRRLAALQKRRELKNAGINIKISHRKKGEMDYNADIPFEKKAAPGFYDTQEEMAMNEREREAFDPRKSQLANKRKAAEQQQDDGDSKRRKGDSSQEAAAKAAAKAGQMQKLREAEQSSKRRSLVLPAPQVGESELEDIVKMGMAGQRASRMAGQGENDATRDLVGDYSGMVQSTPIRTPRAPPQEDHIANEVRNIQALTNTQSSLLGGENTPMHEGAASTGFEGATPRRNVTATPNPMATPKPQGTNGTSRQPNGPGATPLRTPRDNFAINRQGAQGSSLKARLAALPKPKESEWELEVPEDQAEPASKAALGTEDAAERDRRNAAIAEAARQAELRRRSQTLRRGLPRPANFRIEEHQRQCSTIKDPAQKIIAEEIGNIIAYEAAKYPPQNSKVAPKLPPFERLSDEALANARAMLITYASKPPSLTDERISSTPPLQRGSLVPYGYDDDEEAQHDFVAAAKLFDDLQISIGSQAQGSNEKEKKLALHFGGYQQRAKTLRQKIVEAAESLEKARVQLNSFQTMQINEGSVLSLRLSGLRDEVAFLSRREREAQDAYRETRDHLEALRATIPNGVS